MIFDILVIGIALPATRQCSACRLGKLDGCGYHRTANCGHCHKVNAISAEHPGAAAVFLGTGELRNNRLKRKSKSDAILFLSCHDNFCIKGILELASRLAAKYPPSAFNYGAKISRCPVWPYLDHHHVLLETKPRRSIRRRVEKIAHLVILSALRASDDGSQCRSRILFMLGLIPQRMKWDQEQKTDCDYSAQNVVGLSHTHTTCIFSFIGGFPLPHPVTNDRVGAVASSADSSSSGGTVGLQRHLDRKQWPWTSGTCSDHVLTP